MKILSTLLFSGAAVIALLGTILLANAKGLKGRYRDAVEEGINRTADLETPLIRESDLEGLPAPVADYLKIVGVVGKPIVRNVKVEFEAEMRKKGGEWFRMDAEQHNFFDSYERFFYLDAKVKGLPTKGFHRYKKKSASMEIKLLGIFTVAEATGAKLFEAETVTLFNDMCFLAPATLISKDIKWEEIDERTVKAVFTNQGVSISALLYFNEKGELVNFVSDDRFDINAGEKYRFSTPLYEHRNISGFKLPSYGEAVWHYPDGEFTYGKFRVKNIEYNVKR